MCTVCYNTVYNFKKLSYWSKIVALWMCNRVQRKSVLQPVIRASCSQHVLAHKSFRLAPKPFLITRIDYSPSSSKNSTCPLGKLRTKVTSPVTKSTSPGLSDTTFFARCASIQNSTSIFTEKVLKNDAKNNLKTLLQRPSMHGSSTPRVMGSQYHITKYQLFSQTMKHSDSAST